MTINREMPRYDCHKQVWALKIASVQEAIRKDAVLLTFDDDGYAPIYVDFDWYYKHKPETGGYYVVYKGGYTSYSPAKAFEEGYRPVQTALAAQPSATVPDSWAIPAVDWIRNNYQDYRNVASMCDAMLAAAQASGQAASAITPELSALAWQRAIAQGDAAGHMHLRVARQVVELMGGQASGQADDDYTVTVQPDPRGMHVAVHRGSHCVHAEVVAQKAEPSDDAIAALAKQYDVHHGGFMGFARALLARYGAQPAAKPCPWADVHPDCAQQPAASAEPVALDGVAITAAINEYLDGYELCGDDGTHTPTEGERFMIYDAMHGILADEEFLALLRCAPVAAQAPQDERAAFEEWHQSSMWAGDYDPESRDANAYVIGDDGHYCDLDTQRAWRGWQARAAQAPAAAGDAHPMQPIVLSADGRIRFKKNAIVEHLLDFAWPRGCDMNELARMSFSDEDRMQFAQLIGYSVSGYGELSYASIESVAKADAIGAAMSAGREVDNG